MIRIHENLTAVWLKICVAFMQCSLDQGSEGNAETPQIVQVPVAGREVDSPTLAHRGIGSEARMKKFRRSWPAPDLGDAGTLLPRVNFPDRRRDFLRSETGLHGELPQD